MDAGRRARVRLQLQLQHAEAAGELEPGSIGADVGVRRGEVGGGDADVAEPRGDGDGARRAGAAGVAPGPGDPHAGAPRGGRGGLEVQAAATGTGAAPVCEGVHGGGAGREGGAGRGVRPGAQRQAAGDGAGQVRPGQGRRGQAAGHGRRRRHAGREGPGARVLARPARHGDVRRALRCSGHGVVRCAAQGSRCCRGVLLPPTPHVQGQDARAGRQLLPPPAFHGRTDHIAGRRADEALCQPVSTG